MKRRYLTSFVLILSLAFQPLALAVDAQDAIPESSGVEISRFDENQKFMDKNKNMKRRMKKKKTSDMISRNELPIAKIPAGPRFEVLGFEFLGNQIISDHELFSVVQGEIHRMMGMDGVQKLASMVKKHYRDLGFVAAYVYLPPQTIRNGVVKIAVVEGVLDNVAISGNKYFSDKVIKRFLDVDSGQVAYVDQLRKGLTFLNKHRDLNIKANLKPGSAPQTTELELSVEEDYPLHLTLDLNNLGTRNTGTERFGVGLQHTNLFGQLDQLTTRFQIGSNAWAVGADYNIPVHSSGTRVGVRYSYSQVDLGGDFKALNVEGDSTSAGLYVLQPVADEDWYSVAVNAGFDFKDVDNKILGRDAGKDDLRILSMGVDTEFTDRWGKTYFPHSVKIGFSSILGASDVDDPAATRRGSGGEFYIYNTSLIRYHRLPWGLVYAFRGQVQLTYDRLPPSEQIRLGGAFSVRGYPEGEFLADSGAFMRNEIYVPSFFFPEDWKLPYNDKPLRDQIQWIAFFDFGGGDINTPINGENSSRTLAGTGIGVRIHLFDKVYARAQLATPTGSGPSDDSDTTFYYGITTEVF